MTDAVKLIVASGIHALIDEAKRNRTVRVEAVGSGLPSASCVGHISAR